MIEYLATLGKASCSIHSRIHVLGVNHTLFILNQLLGERVSCKTQQDKQRVVLLIRGCLKSLETTRMPSWLLGIFLVAKLKESESPDA